MKATTDALPQLTDDSEAAAADQQVAELQDKLKDISRQRTKLQQEKQKPNPELSALVEELAAAKSEARDTAAELGRGRQQKQRITSGMVLPRSQATQAATAIAELPKQRTTYTALKEKIKQLTARIQSKERSLQESALLAEIEADPADEAAHQAALAQLERKAAAVTLYLPVAERQRNKAIKRAAEKLRPELEKQYQAIIDKQAAALAKLLEVAELEHQFSRQAVGYGRTVSDIILRAYYPGCYGSGPQSRNDPRSLIRKWALTTKEKGYRVPKGLE